MRYSPPSRVRAAGEAKDKDFISWYIVVLNELVGIQNIVIYAQAGSHCEF